MAYKIEWTRRASIELAEIYNYYYLAASAKVARERAAKIAHGIKQLQEWPNMGRLDNDYPHTPTYRYIVVLDYRIYYFMEDDVVNIAAIWDCRQGGLTF